MASHHRPADCHGCTSTHNVSHGDISQVGQPFGQFSKQQQAEQQGDQDEKPGIEGSLQQRHQQLGQQHLVQHQDSCITGCHSHKEVGGSPEKGIIPKDIAEDHQGQEETNQGPDQVRGVHAFTSLRGFRRGSSRARLWNNPPRMMSRITRIKPNW